MIKCAVNNFYLQNCQNFYRIAPPPGSVIDGLRAHTHTDTIRESDCGRLASRQDLLLFVRVSAVIPNWHFLQIKISETKQKTNSIRKE